MRCSVAVVAVLFWQTFEDIVDVRCQMSVFIEGVDS